MKKLGTVLFAAAALAFAAPEQAEGQAQTIVGPYLAYHDDADLGIGAFVTFPVASIHENFAIKADFGYYFPGDEGFGGVDVTYVEFNADGLMGFPLEGNDAIRPFAFAGLNVARISVSAEGVGGGSASDTEIGINLGGGISFTNMGSVRPSVGGKIELSGGEGFVLFGALGFPVGGGS